MPGHATKLIESFRSKMFRVVKCIECEIFQVDFVKKAKKWNCKVCNCCQIIKVIYFTSSAGKKFCFEKFKFEIRLFLAKECRVKAQEMNFEYQQTQHKKGESLLNQFEARDEEDLSEKVQACNGRSKYARFRNLNEQDVRSTKRNYMDEVKSKADETSSSFTSRYSKYEDPRPLPLPDIINTLNHTPYEPYQKKPKPELDDDFFLTQEDTDNLDELH